MAESMQPSVMVTEVKEQEIANQTHFIGRVEAIKKVALIARVEGILQPWDFIEGTVIEADSTLFQIEKAAYEIAVEQKQASVASAQAKLKNAKAELKRAKSLRKKNAISEADYDTAVANEASAAALLLAEQAGLKKAQLDLSYTDIKSPIAGRISRASVSAGNLVGPSSGTLATVTSIDPIYVTIAVGEKLLINARKRGINMQNPPVKPSITLSDGSAYEHEGDFDFIDTHVNQSTDTLLVRAVFPNPEQVLVPGQYVNVTVRQKEATLRMVVPQAAMQKDQTGYYVLVVNQNNRVEIRRVQAGEQVNQVWVVLDGLAEGERVIVQGVQKVKANSEVKAVPYQ
ncbi:MAG: efflux RND transporter periplasmic adaptor subunit [Pseudomonadales bacterium]|nr:efflux RND transporter periplasmic adaptor subunit [Pseudomonadales bacterium]